MCVLIRVPEEKGPEVVSGISAANSSVRNFSRCYN